MSASVFIRAARVGEHAEIEALQARASLADEVHREALLAHPWAIATPVEQIRRGQVFVATAAGTIRGFAVVVPRADGDAELDGLFVEPGEQRRGIGRALVERSVAEARRLGAAALHVVANPSAAAFYAATGFERRGETPTRFGPALLLLRRVATR